jgi:hypothetical protein
VLNVQLTIQPNVILTNTPAHWQIKLTPEQKKRADQNRADALHRRYSTSIKTQSPVEGSHQPLPKSSSSSSTAMKRGPAADDGIDCNYAVRQCSMCNANTPFPQRHLTLTVFDGTTSRQRIKVVAVEHV